MKKLYIPMYDFTQCLFDSNWKLPDISPYDIREELKRAYEDSLRKYERYEYIKTKATTPGAIRYDKDRVQSSNHFDLTEVVIRMQEAEEAWHEAEKHFSDVLQVFVQYLNKAEFNPTTEKIWLLRYGNCWTLRQVALSMNISLGKVQYHLGEKYEKQFLEQVA